MAGRSYEFLFTIGAAISSTFRSSMSQSALQITNLENKLRSLDKTGRAVQSAFDKGVINSTAYQNAMRSLSGQNGKVNSQLGAARYRAFRNSINDAITFSYAVRNVADAFMAPIGAAMEFESTMADVRKVVDFDTPQQFKMMSSDILELSTRIPMSANGLGKIVAAAGQAGIAKNELTGFAESAAKMGIAFDITAEQAGDMMAKWRTAFKMDQQEVNSLADKVNYLGNTTSASAPKISDVVTRIGPLGAVGGVASGAIAAMGASIVGAGIESEIAATGIKNLILGLTSGQAATKKQAAAFAQLGLSAEEVSKAMQTDSKGTILDVLQRVKQLDSSQQAAVLKNLFGKESIAAIAPLLSNLDKLKENLDKVADAEKYSGSMEKEYQERIKTTEASLQLMRNAAHSAKVALGNVLLPIIPPLAKAFGGAAQSLGWFATQHPRVVTAAVSVAGAVTGLVAAGYAWRIAATGMTAAFSGLRTGFRIFAQLPVYARNLRQLAAAQKVLAAGQKVMSTGFTLLTSPIGHVILAVLALAAVAYVVYKNWDKVRVFFTNLWKSPTARVLMFVTGPIGWLVAAVSWVCAHWEQVRAFFVRLWNDPQGAVDDFVTYIKSQIGSAVDWVMDKWRTLQNFLSHPIDGVVNIARHFTGGGDAEPKKHLASGGIFGRGAFVTSFAEDSAEAAIPINGSRRSLGLWAETGRRLGVMSSKQGGTGDIVVNYSPTISVGSGAQKDDVMAAEQMSLVKLRRMLAELKNERRRLAYD